MARCSVRQNSCIVMVCGGREADQVRRQLSAQKTVCLTTYRRVEDMVLNSPTGRVVLVILAGKDCLLYTSPSPRDRTRSRMPSSA